MRRSRLRRGTAGYLALGLLIPAVASTYLNYNGSIYQADRATAWLSRAETAAFAEDMIAYMEEARRLIPRSGNPVWWFPTQCTEFKLIQADIESMMERARILQGLPRDSESYQQGMDDLRGKLRTLQDQIGESAPFMFASPQSLVLSVLWLVAETALVSLYFKPERRE